MRTPTPIASTKKLLILLSLLLSLLLTGRVLAQTETPAQKMSVTDRLNKARAAKADKRQLKAAGGQAAAQQATPPVPTANRFQEATPSDKPPRGPHGEAVYKGEHGALYYINKNGNKTYLSSNQ